MQVAYTLDSESCLHTILGMIDSKKQGHTPPLSLLQAAMSLLQCLWQGRHDAALIALRSSNNFWENLTKPLFSVVQLPAKDGEKVSGCKKKFKMLQWNISDGICGRVLRYTIINVYTPYTCTYRRWFTDWLLVVM